MTQVQSFRLLVAHLVVALSTIVAASVLCGLGKMDAQAATALFGAAIGLVGSTSVTLGAAAINGGPKADLTKLAESSPTDLAAAMGAQK